MKFKLGIVMIDVNKWLVGSDELLLSFEVRIPNKDIFVFLNRNPNNALTFRLSVQDTEPYEGYEEDFMRDGEIDKESDGEIPF